MAEPVTGVYFPPLVYFFVKVGQGFQLKIGYLFGSYVTDTDRAIVVTLAVGPYGLFGSPWFHHAVSPDYPMVADPLKPPFPVP